MTDNQDHAESWSWPGNQHTDITDWVVANYAPVRVGDYTVYDLTAPPKH